MEVIKLGQKAINKAADVIKKGGVVVFPTDTVYGFIADAANKKAVGKIYKIKKRARSKPLPVFVKDIKIAQELANISKDQEKVLKKHWPGKYTFVLEIRKTAKLYGQDKKTIALRIPKYKFLNDLLKKINKPLVQTSVNISGEPELKKIKEIIEKFKDNKNKPNLIINRGNLLKSKSSKIVDLTREDKVVLRY
jgi:L-threonylcarbamoyladenylate synthase